jgi:hypothetical protein
VIETGAQLVEDYAAAFKAAGFDPETCPGVAWAKQLVQRRPHTTAHDVIERIHAKIKDGTADHGWLFGILRFLWDEIGEEQRLRMFEMLADGGAHKKLIDKRTFPVLTERERAWLAVTFEARREVAALRRLQDG